MSTELKVDEDQRRRREELKAWLSSPKVQQEIRASLPPHMTPDKFARTIVTATAKNTDLVYCTRASWWFAILTAAQMGLEADGYEGHMIPRKNKGILEVQFQSDYKGLIKLAYQSKMVKAITAKAVYSGDHFEYKLGTSDFIDHVPCEDEGKRGSLRFSYSICKLINGGEPFVVLNRAEVMAHKKAGQGSNSAYSPWNKPETEPAMWSKTAFRELSKFIPRSSSLQRAISIETEHERMVIGNEVPIIVNEDEGGNSDGYALPAPSKTESLTEQLEAARSLAREQREPVPVQQPTKANGRKAANAPQPAANIGLKLYDDIASTTDPDELMRIGDDIDMYRSKDEISHDEKSSLKQAIKDRLKVLNGE
jgi:recombination protein RecT